jgi:preprotein translocase subunit YajC
VAELTGVNKMWLSWAGVATVSGMAQAQAAQPAQEVVVGAPAKPATAAAAAPAATEATPVIAQPAGTPTAAPSPMGGMSGMLFLLLPLGMLVLLIFMQSRAAKKDRLKKEELMNGLARNDRVQTSGGIIGNIVEMGDGEVVLKVDDVSNTRIRFSKAAIVSVIKKSGASGSLESKPAATVTA